MKVQQVEPNVEAALSERIAERWKRILAAIYLAVLKLTLRHFSFLAYWPRKVADGYREQAIREYAAGNLPASAQYLRKAIDTFPANSSFYSDLGHVLYELGDLKGAEEYFGSALKHDFNHAGALRGLAFSFQASGKLAEAVYYYLRYLQLDNTDATVLLNLGVALANQGKYAEALQYYKEAEKLEPGNPIIKENRGRAFYAEGKYERAIVCLRSALELDPANADARGMLALCLETVGRDDDALANYREIVARDPENADVRRDLSILLERTGRYQDAAQQMSEALKIYERRGDSKGSSEAHWELGWVYYDLNEMNRSIEESSAALDINPRLFQARFNLALALLHQGEREAAKNEYLKGAGDISQPGDFKYWAIDDLEAALERTPDLAGGRELLSILKAQYKAMRKDVRGKAEASPA